jgi:hypothetical protein
MIDAVALLQHGCCEQKKLTERLRQYGLACAQSNQIEIAWYAAAVQGVPHAEVD